MTTDYVLQKNYSTEQPVGHVGDVPDIGRLHEDRAYLNDDPRAAKIVTVTIDTAADDTDYTVTIEEHDITVTSDSTATKTEIRDLLVDAINNDPEVNGFVTAAAGNSDDFTITADQGGVNFTFSESDANLSSTTTQSNATADAVPFGRAVLFHGLNTSGQSDNEPLARLADAADLTERDIQLTLDSSPDGQYTVVLEVDDRTVLAQFTAATSSTDDILNGLQSDLNSDNLLDASVDTSPSPSELHITSADAGFADFRIVGINTPGSATFTRTIDAEGDDIRELFAGVAKREPNLIADATQDPNLSQYPGGERMAVRSLGPIVVEAEDDLDLSSNPDGKVFVRVRANGNLDRLGAFRSDHNAGCIPLPVAQFTREYPNKLDELQVRGARV